MEVVLEQPLPPLMEIITWRFGRLEEAGYPVSAAVEIAERTDIDLHHACELLERGCPLHQALSILR